MMSEYTLMRGLIHQEKTNSQRDVVETGFLAVPFLFLLYLSQSLIWMQSLENSCSRHELPVRSSILGMSWALSPNLGTLSLCLDFLWDIKDEFRRHRACLLAIVLDTTGQTGLKLEFLWLPLPEFWDCCCAPPWPLTLWFFFVFTLRVWMFYLHVCICTTYVSSAFGEQKSVRSSGPGVTDSCVSTCGYRELTQSPHKGSVCPSPPSHLPGLIVNFSFSTRVRKISMVTNSLLCWKQIFA